jgi:hypothetical protein
MDDDATRNAENAIRDLDMKLHAWNKGLLHANYLFEDFSSQIQDILRWISQLNSKIDQDYAIFMDKLKADEERATQQWLLSQKSQAQKTAVSSVATTAPATAIL